MVTSLPLCRFTVAKLPLWHLLWLVAYHHGPFCGRYVTIITTFKIGKLPLGLVLWLAVYHYGQFMVVTIPLWPLFHGLKDTLLGGFMVGN